MTPLQLPLGVRLRDSSVLASFYAGRNQPTLDALLALTPAAGPICVWLYGPTGTGKSHLLQALCARAAQSGQSAAYLPMRELLASGPGMLSGYGEWHWVALDDAGLIAGQDEWERALFALHQELEERRGRLLLSGTSAPNNSGFRLRDLASRMNGGLVLKLQTLDEAEQQHALRLRAQLRGFELPDETAQYMLRRLPRDMASLCRVLDELDEASLIAQRRLTVPFVREVLDAHERLPKR